MTERPIRLRNSMTGRKEVFRPIDPQDVRMYVCGPTVYDRAHIGNARPAVVFDVLFRLLRHVYGEAHVTYVRNLTDVEDKINARAAEIFSDLPPEEGIARLTRRTIDWYHEDMAALGVLPPTHEPRATEHIAGMIAMIEALIEAGCAYVAEGHVLFDVAARPDYGRLSKRSVDDMIAGARVEVAPYKRNAMDFVLWKPSEAGQPGWPSPWGRGRPGWHIECSAMSDALLGPDFDIHGGGADLLFPHHENELAQSMCAHPGHSFARVWLHNEMIVIDGRKMSKSLGNFVTVHDLRETVPGEVIRLALLSSHYRSKLDWTDKLVADTRKTLRRWREAAEGAEGGEPDAAVLAALADDLNTPRAIAALHRLASEGKGAALKASAALLGLLGDEMGGWAEARETGADAADAIERLLAARAEARKARDFARADAIRDRLAAAGVVTKDTPQGAEWEIGPDFDPARLEAIE